MSIKANFAKSGMWMVTGAIFNNLSSTAIFIVLARLLTPVQFGIVAFATIFIDLSRVLVVAGIPDALIQRKEWDDKVASSAFWTNIAIASLICALIGGIATPISYFVYDATFALVLLALSLALFVEAITAVHTAKLRREFRYKAIASRNMAANVLGGAIGIALAWIGWGVWALVVSRLLSASITSIILWRTSGWQPRLFFRWSDVRSLSGMSSHLLANQLIGQANSQIAGLVIGAAIGPAALAQFRVGTRVLNLMAQLIITPLQAAAMSAFSRLGDEGRPIAPAYVRVTRSCSLLACPIFFGMAAIAPDFTRIIFGPQWHEAGLIMIINSLVVGPSVIMYFFIPALASANRSALSLRFYIVSLVVTGVTALTAIPFGPLAASSTKAIESHVTLPYGLKLTRQGIGLRPIDNLRAIAPAYLAALIMAMIVMAIGYYELGKFQPWQRMPIMVAIGGLIYPAFLALFARQFLRETLGELAFLKNRFGRKPPSSRAPVPDTL
jgi:PST family polysaccharide transporter